MSEQTQNKLQIEGRIAWVSEITTGTTAAGKEWQKGQFAIEYLDNDKIIPVAFQSWGTAAAILSRLHVGDWVSVSFKPESRTHDNKFYTDLKAYYIHIHFGKKAPFEEQLQEHYKQNVAQNEK